MSEGKYIALSSIGAPLSVTALCEVLERTEDYYAFTCVNGGWGGKYFPESKAIAFNALQDDIYGVIKVWEGAWPEGCRGYNEAIPAIEALLRANEGKTK